MRIEGGYIIHKFSTGKYAVCKILDEFNSEDKALELVINLTSGAISEKDLLKNIVKKETTDL